jgi:hypothetical protein
MSKFIADTDKAQARNVLDEADNGKPVGPAPTHSGMRDRTNENVLVPLVPDARYPTVLVGTQGDKHVALRDAVSEEAGLVVNERTTKNTVA